MKQHVSDMLAGFPERQRLRNLTRKIKRQPKTRAAIPVQVPMFPAMSAHDETQFFCCASSWLACRLVVMGGKVEEWNDHPKLPPYKALEGALQGMVDNAWEMKRILICGSSPTADTRHYSKGASNGK